MGLRLSSATHVDSLAPPVRALLKPFGIIHIKTQLEYTEKVIADLKSKILKNEKSIKKSQPEDSMECCYLLSALKGKVFDWLVLF